MSGDIKDALQESLKKAAHDKDLHYAFYADFGGAEIYALLQSDLPQGKSVLEKNTQIHLQELTYEGKQYVPVFSSLALLKDFVKNEARYIAVKGRDIVSMVHGRELFLNPGSEYRKVITRKEMAYINSAAPSELPQQAVRKPSGLKKLFGGKK